MESTIRKQSKEFLNLNPNYEKDINLYVHYVESIGKGDYLVAITKQDIIACIKHYNKLKKIGSEATLARFISVIKNLYIDLDNRRVVNNIFASLHINSNEDFINEIKKDIDFSPITERSFFENEIMIEILEKLELYFEKNDYETLKHDTKKTVFEWYLKYSILRLFIKIILIAPGKKKDIVNITLSENLDIENRSLKINDALINIPCGLYRDIKQHLKIRSEYVQKNPTLKSDRVFIYKGFDPTNLNHWFGQFIFDNDIFEIEPSYRKGAKDSSKEYPLYSCPVEPIMNTALYNMLISGTNPVLVAKMNGTTIGSMAEKFCNDEYINTLTNFKSDFNSLINAGISKNFYYKYI